MCFFLCVCVSFWLCKKEEGSEVGVTFLLASVFTQLYLNLPYPAPQWEKEDIYRERQSTESMLLLGIIGL